MDKAPIFGKMDVAIEGSGQRESRVGLDSLKKQGMQMKERENGKKERDCNG